MNFFVFADSRFQRLRSITTDFLKNIQRLIKASPIFGGIVVLSGLALGLGPALWWQFVGKFINTAYSARGVGTMTSDLTHSSIWLMALIIIIIAALIYAAKTKSLARQIVQTLAIIGIVVTHLVALFPIVKSFTFFLIITVIAFHFAKHRAVQMIICVLFGLLALSTSYDLLVMMTYRVNSVGNTIGYLGMVITISSLCVLLPTGIFTLASHEPAHKS